MDPENESQESTTNEPVADNSNLDEGLVSDMLAEDSSYSSDEKVSNVAPEGTAAPSTVAPTQGTASSEPAPAVVPPVAPPVATPPVAAQTEAQPPQPAAAQPPPSQEEPPAQVVDFAKHRQEYLPKLAELYALNDQEVEVLRTSPETALPQLAARLHYEVQVASTQAIMQMLPTLIENQMKEGTARRANEDRFFGDWPSLKDKVTADPKAEAVIVSAIKSVRANNPQADMASIIKQAGILASMTLGVPLPGTAPAGSPPPVAPAGAPRQMGRPAGVGASGGGVAPSAPSGERDDIAEIFGDWQAGAT